MEDLYEDFHLIKLPLLPKEVRGPDSIRQFSDMLIHPVDFVRQTATGPAAAADCAMDAQ